MVADSVKGYGPISDDGDKSLLTDEEKQELEAKRAEQETVARNQALTNAIVGNSSEELENRYDSLKRLKQEQQGLFNEEHHVIVTQHHPNYSAALRTRATKGWAKLNLKNIYDISTANVKNLLEAILTGDYSNLKFLPSGMNEERTKQYVSNQNFEYTKQNKTDLENYKRAQDDYNLANNAAHEADGTLTDAIDYERGLVSDMKVTDDMMRQTVINMNYLG